jgi:uncharacterized membrane protein YdjX (TVP38/TMEM64 family)
MRLFLLVAAIVGILLVPLFIFGDEIDETFGGEEGLARLQSYGDRAWLVGIALIVGDLVLPVPSTAVIAALGMIYGPWFGGVLGGVGSVLAGLVAYGGCRLIGQPVLKLLAGGADIAKLSRFFENYGLWAIALSRWMPLLPEALCCLAGMSRMKFAPFACALSCGSFAMGMAFAFLGQAYLDRPVLGLVLSAVIPLAIWPMITIWLKKREDSPTSEG